MKKPIVRAAVAFVVMGSVGVFAAPPAAAYLDPGSGSYLIQLLIGSLLGAGLAIKVFWGRIVSFFRRSKPAEDGGSAVDTASTDEG